VESVRAKNNSSKKAFKYTNRLIEYHYKMAYEKYIKKNGKLYGPYIYHSKRVDGKVITEYYGQKKFEYRKFFLVLVFVAIIIFGAYLIGHKEKKTTGYSILGINANYQEGQPLKGNLVFLLRQGELVPAESSVIFENNDQRYEYTLSEITQEEMTEGNFFVAGKNLSGFGSGFGLAGTKKISPEVNFVLLIYSKINETENTEKEREIQGSVTSGNNFIYELQEGERVELKPRSVKALSANGTKQLADKDVTISTEGNKIIVTTQYTEDEIGFGDDYIGEKTKKIDIDLNSLNLTLQPGALVVSVIYHSEELVSLRTTINDSDKSISDKAAIIPETTKQEQNLAQTPENTVNNEINGTEKNIIPLQKLELTSEEKNALMEKFGNISLVIKTAKEKNGFIIVRYELGNFWIEYSYSSELDNETLKTFMEADKIKWLKDLAQNLLQPKELEREINIS